MDGMMTFAARGGRSPALGRAALGRTALGRTALGLAAVGSAALGLAALSGGAARAAEPPPIKIGCSMAMTGGVAVIGAIAAAETANETRSWVSLDA